MYQITADITEDFVLKNLSQEQIMEHYLGVPVTVKKKFSSPFREDKNPSCSMMYKDGRLIFKDFADNAKPRNCFHIVMHQYRCNFYEALKHISDDFGLINGVKTPRKVFTELEKEKDKGNTHTEIAIKVRPWNKADMEYWFKRFGITRKVLKKFKVYPVDTAWLNGSVMYSYYSDDDPCYAYRLAPGEYKLYFPFRKGNNTFRFIHNTQRVQGYRQLPKEGEFIVLTKSMKDIMVLFRYGINSIALPSESVYPDPHFIDIIQKRFKYVFSLYDFDKGGIPMAGFLKREYFIFPFFLTNGLHGSEVDYGAKDMAEYREKYGHDKTEKLIIETKKYIEDELEENINEIPYY